MQFFYSATNGSDTGSVVAFVSGNEATANLSDLLPATTYTVYGVVTATNGSTPQSSSTTFTTEGARTDHAAWYELPAKDNAGSNMLLRTFYDTARNYTMYYDTSTYTAYWVAYPLAAGDLGSGRPNDPWAATPGIPTSQQINVWAGSYGVNVGSTSNIYARGHQIPNADRNKDPYGTRVRRRSTLRIPRRRFRTGSTPASGVRSKVTCGRSHNNRPIRFTWLRAPSYGL